MGRVALSKALIFVMENAGRASALLSNSGGCAPELHTEMRSAFFSKSLRMSDTNLSIEAIHTFLVTLIKLIMFHSKFSSFVDSVNTCTCFIHECVYICIRIYIYIHIYIYIYIFMHIQLLLLQ